MRFSTYKEFVEFAKLIVSITYDVKDLIFIDLEQNNHPSKGFTKATLSNMNRKLFCVVAISNDEILLSKLTKEE